MDTIEALKQTAEALAGQLRTAGLDVTVNAMEEGAFYSRINAGDSDIYFHKWGAGRGTCDEIWRQHFHSSTRDGQTFTGFTSPQIDELLDSAFSVVPDMEAANEYYIPLMDTLMDESPWAPIVNPDQIFAVAKNVDGFIPSPVGQLDVTQVIIAE